MSATHYETRVWSLAANSTYTIETLGLSAGADTVLHVQKYPEGTFVDGNDDCYTRLNGCLEPRSYVQVNTGATAMSVWVVVRARTTATGGTGTLRVTGGGSVIEGPIAFTYGYFRSFSSFSTNDEFRTVEQQGESSDTVLLLTRGAEHGLGFDDDNALGYMSWASVSSDRCTADCRVYVGSYYSPVRPHTTLIWDNCADWDTDADYVVDTLETAVGTDLGYWDTDNDGLEDEVELLGRRTTAGEVSLPTYGSDPVHKDLFVEGDWKECVAPAGSTLCGTTPDPDYYRMRSPEAQILVNTYAPDVAVHIDTGEPNTDPATWTSYGAWGGATRNTGSGDNCEWLAPARVGLFHDLALDGGGGSAIPGTACGNASNGGRHLAHELGHDLTILHGGYENTVCKPNYHSVMNYSVMYDNPSINFSRNRFAARPLRPTAVDESLGLGTTDPAVLAVLTKSAMRFTVDTATGAVDWNRDGLPTTGPTRAAVTWGWDTGAGGCAVGTQNATAKALPNRSGGAMVWALGSPPRLHWFANRETDGKLEWRSATDVSGTAPVVWSPPLTGDGQIFGKYITHERPAVARWAMTGAASLVAVAYVDKDSRLVLESLTVGSDSNLATTSWSLILPAMSAIDGAPALLRVGSDLHVYAVHGSTLSRWVVDSTGKVTSGPVGQLWADGTTLQASHGIALTNAAVWSGTSVTVQLFGAIPLGGSATPAGQIEVAVRDSTTGRWARLADAAWPVVSGVHTKVRTDQQPGLAYVPFDYAREGSLRGRLYLAFAPGGGAPLQIMQTQGNIDALSGGRRLAFIDEPQVWQNKWAYSVGGVTLSYEPGYDGNLRGSWTFKGAPHYLEFFPLADGISDVDLKDYDDVNAISTWGLRCSLGHGACVP